MATFQSVALLGTRDSEAVQLAAEFPSLEACVEEIVHDCLHRSCTWVNVTCCSGEGEFHVRVSSEGKRTSFSGSCALRLDVENGMRLTSVPEQLSSTLGKISLLSSGVIVAFHDLHGIQRRCVQVQDGNLCRLNAISQWFGGNPKPRSRNITIYSLYQNVPVRKRDLLDNSDKHLETVKSLLSLVSLQYPSVSISLDLVALGQGCSSSKLLLLRETSSLHCRLRQTGLLGSFAGFVPIKSAVKDKYSLEGLFDVSGVRRSKIHALFLNGHVIRGSCRMYQQFFSLLHAHIPSIFSRKCLLVLFVKERKLSGTLKEAISSLEANLQIVVVSLRSELEAHCRSPSFKSENTVDRMVSQEFKERLACDIHVTACMELPSLSDCKQLAIGCSSSSVRRLKSTTTQTPLKSTTISSDCFSRHGNTLVAGKTRNQENKKTHSFRMMDAKHSSTGSSPMDMLQQSWIKVADFSLSEAAWTNVRSERSTPSLPSQHLHTSISSANFQSSTFQQHNICAPKPQREVALSQPYPQPSLSVSGRQQLLCAAPRRDSQELNDLIVHWRNPVLGSSAKVRRTLDSGW